jgi:hypothetical protein
MIEEVSIGPSPHWMSNRLEKVGIRSINNVVDVTNYVMMEYGQPLHAFDYEKIAGKEIIVRRARPSEEIISLDNVTRKLTPDMLVIADRDRAVAIAGVMGGGNSEIVDGTRRVLIESAYFNPASVRRTSKKLGLSTEASYRFERGADWENAVTAIARACCLIQELAGGCIAGSVQDVYPKPMRPADIRLERPHAEAIIGVDLEADSMHHYFEKVCLLQIATDSASYLMDPLALRDLSVLQPVFSNPRIRKIFHGADYDVRSLYRDFQVEVENLFDTQLACKFLGLRETGLDSLLRNRFQVELNKKFQRADWSQRPLSTEMLEYAAMDGGYLIPLAHMLKKELEEKIAHQWEEVHRSRNIVMIQCVVPERRSAPTAVGSAALLPLRMP